MLKQVQKANITFNSSFSIIMGVGFVFWVTPLPSAEPNPSFYNHKERGMI